MNPWTCPKCGRVWSGLVTQCQPCNAKIDRKERGKRWTFDGTSREDMRLDTARPTKPPPKPSDSLESVVP